MNPKIDEVDFYGHLYIIKEVVVAMCPIPVVYKKASGGCFGILV